MNKHVKISLIVLVAVVLLLAVTIPSLAKNPDKFFTLRADYVSDLVSFTYTGSFDSDGAIDDKGPSWGHWVRQPGGRRGMSFFQSEVNTEDMFVIEWKIPWFDFDDEDCVDGTFTIITSLGTGKYEGLWGTGTLKSCRPGMGDTGYMILEGRVP